uniref:Retrovirus-related Pol polyprotein from transposon TNT 1-94 n=1 Tax=Tanacetum cinerariifolium TaxID=118510 RepID=A0A6L2P416_TANCI|nr:retrovirus-related Pol polyprotein from transposon TNT 1-94 [Tanacetum cinerariifolium]
MNQFCQMKRIKREFNVARTAQQNGVVERKNRTLNEAARTMLGYSLLPTTFWAEAVNSKFDDKADEGFLVRHFVNSKAFRVFNSRTRKVMKNLHVNFLETKPNVAGRGPEWLFDIDSLTKSMNYEPVSTRNQSSGNAGDVNTGDIQGVLKKYQEMIILNINTVDSNHTNMSTLEATSIFDGAFDDRDLGAEADTNNLDSSTVMVIHALKYPNWIEAIQKELLQFKLQDVWTLVDLPYGKRAIGSKWVFRNKLNERVARIESIRLFLAYASFKDFIVYQMDVKSVFLYGKIEEDVYVYQPPGFEDPDFPDKVYKVKKALYDCKHSDGNFKPPLNDEDGQEVDVHIYRSMIGSLMYLTSLRLDIIFLVCAYARNQTVVVNSTTEAEYVAASSCCGQKNYALLVLVFQTTPQMVINSPCLTDKKELASPWQTTTVNPTIYVSCVKQFWATTKVNKNSDQEQIQALVDKMKVIITEDNIRSDPRLDDAEGIMCLLNKEIFEGLARMGTMASAIICLADNQKFNFSKYIFNNMVKSLEGGVKFYLFPRFLQVFLDKQVEGMARYKEMYIVSSHTKKIFANIKRIGAGFSGKPLNPRMKQRNEAKTSYDESTDEDHVPTPSSDPLPSAKVAQAKKITALKKKVSKLNKWRKSRSRGLERLKKFGSIRRVKSPMKKDDLGAQEDASKQGRMIEEIDQNAKIALDDETQGRINDDEMFEVDDLAGEEVVVETTTGVKDSVAPITDVTEDEITMAQALAILKSVKPKVVVQEQEMSTTIPAAATKVITFVPTPRAKGIVFHKQKQSHIPFSSLKDKGKAKMIEPEVPLKKKDQMRIDEEYARKLQAKEQEAARLSRAQQDEEANNSQDNIQAMTNADRLLAKSFKQEKGKNSLRCKRQDYENVKPVVDDSKELRKCIEIVLDDGDEVLIESTPISSRSPTIIDYKIHKEGKKTYFKLIRADGNS